MNEDMAKAFTLDDLCKEVTERHNQVVITAGCEVARLIGYATSDEDYYYWFSFANGSRRKETFSSCVIPVVFLKDSLSSEDYNRIDSALSFNGCEAESEVLFKELREK